MLAEPTERENKGKCNNKHQKLHWASGKLSGLLDVLHMRRGRCTTRSSTSTRISQLLTAPSKSSYAWRSPAPVTRSQCLHLTNPYAQRHLLTSTVPDWWEPTDETRCTYVSQAPESPLLRQPFSAACPSSASPTAHITGSFVPLLQCVQQMVGPFAHRKH